MAAKKGSSKIETLTALPGVGAATAKKLIAAKLDSVSKIAGAGAKKLQDAGLSAAIATKVSAAAKTAQKATTTTKSTAKKAKTVAVKSTSKAKAVAKSTAKKAASATKKTAAKATSAAKATAAKAQTASQTVPSKKSKDRKGSTLKVPRSVRDMPWFKPKK
ncbi:MAG: hypothetical protein QNL85_04170 [Euryarchaeota archaeon]